MNLKQNVVDGLQDLVFAGTVLLKCSMFVKKLFLLGCFRRKCTFSQNKGGANVKTLLLL